MSKWIHEQRVHGQCQSKASSERDSGKRSTFVVQGLITSSMRSEHPRRLGGQKMGRGRVSTQCANVRTLRTSQTAQQQTLDRHLEGETHEHQRWVAPHTKAAGDVTERYQATDQSLYLNADDAGPSSGRKRVAPTAACTSQSSHKAKRGVDEEESSATERKRSRSAAAELTDPTGAHLSSSETEDDSTQPLPWAPQSAREVAKPRTPRRRKLAPERSRSAISPSKRRVLVEQSAKETAISQHSHHSSPTSMSRTQGARLLSSTPSPLRAGFSVIDLGPAYLGTVADDGDSDSEDALRDELQVSPLSAHSKRQCSMSRIGYTLSPTSKKKIYAYETQKSGECVQTDDLDDHREADKMKSRTEGNQMKNLSSSSLSSPPPVQTTSSQTESGASWQQRTSPNAMPSSRKESLPETYISDDEVATDSERDATYEDSQWAGDTTIRPLRKITRSISASRQNKDATSIQPCGFDESQGAHSPEQEKAAQEATQILPWDQDQGSTSAQAEDPDGFPPRLPQKRPSKKPADWVAIDKVWSGILSDSTNTAHQSKSQSDLARFGFVKSTVHRKAQQCRDEKAASPTMSEAEDVASDDEGPNSSLSADKSTSQARRLMMQSENSAGSFDAAAETQVLPWHDDTCNFDGREAESLQRRSSHTSSTQGSPGSPTSLLIPSDSGLDSQLRRFLDSL